MSGKKSNTKKIMTEITSGKLQMRPRWHFAAISIMLVTTTLLATLLAAVLTTVLVYDVRIGSDIGIATLAPDGILGYLSTFPWVLIVLLAFSLAATVALARRFEFSHRHHMYSLGAILLGIIIAISFFFSALGADEPLAEFGPIRPVTGFSKFARDRFVGGKITEISDYQATIETPLGDEIEIEWDETTRIKTPDSLEIGEGIDAIGEFENKDDKKTFKADGIRESKHRRIKGLRFPKNEIKPRQLP